MDKVGRPRGLIAYDTERNLEAGAANAEPLRLIRPRVILYAAAIALVGMIMLVALVTRPVLDVNVLHERNPLYVKLSDGGVQNGYTVKLLNKLYQPRAFSLGMEGLPGATLRIVGHEGGVVPVPPDTVQSVKLYVTLPKEAVRSLPSQANAFDFVITDMVNGTQTEHAATFQGPPK